MWYFKESEKVKNRRMKHHQDTKITHDHQLAKM